VATSQQSSRNAQAATLLYERAAGLASAPLSDALSYRRHQPEQSVLYAIVEEHLETLLDNARQRSEHGFGYPRFVEQTFRRYIECGRLELGFCRVRCSGCGFERLLAFSCKRRGVCPSCEARRMADTAAHLCDRVLPIVPYRRPGRDGPYGPPPGQNPACRITAPGSHLGSWRQSARSSRDVRSALGAASGPRCDSSAARSCGPADCDAATPCANDGRPACETAGSLRCWSGSRSSSGAPERRFSTTGLGA